MALSCGSCFSSSDVHALPDIIPNQRSIPQSQLGDCVAIAADFSNGQMRTVQVGEETVLLCRVDNSFYATSAKCTHVGAPLEKGVLNGGRIVCPWHGACFNVRTGDIEEGMVMEPLKTYRVHVVEGKIYISSGERRIAIIGGGASASSAVDQLCKSGFEGRIDVFSDEPVLPYDRTKCSKILSRGAFLRPADFYAHHPNVTIHLGCKVERLDSLERCVQLSDGRKFVFDSALIATGGIPRNITQKVYCNVQTLRNSVDAERMKAALTPTTRLIIIGAGLLGLELASASKLVGKVQQVTVIDSGRRGRDLRGLFGPTVYTSVLKLHEQNGVQIVTGPGIGFIDGEEGAASGVRTVDEEGPVIPGDYFVVVMGIVPATDFLVNIPKLEDGTVPVNSRCRVIGASDIFASGDITTMHNERTGEQIHVEHWGWAMQQGRVAAQNMIGIPIRFHCVPVFWTMHFGQNYRFCGTSIASRPSSIQHSILEILLHAFSGKARKENEVEAVVVGGEEKFEVFYVSNGKISGCASLNSDPTVAASAELLRHNEMITPIELKQGIRPSVRLQELQTVGRPPSP